MQFIPEQNESGAMIQPILGWDATVSTINNKLSPMLPLHFDKSYLPKNLCELQYLKLAQCRLFKKIQHSNVCSYEVAKFQYCRKNRDVRILDGIKQWQTSHINSLQKPSQRMYLQGLTFKLDRLKDQYAKIPSTSSKQMKLSEIQNQVQTLKWRINYIKKMV